MNKIIILAFFIILQSTILANTTPNEIKWLQTHQNLLRLATDPDFAPYEFFDENRKYSDIYTDYAQLIKNKLNSRGLKVYKIH